jgi:hypothetical protein
MRAPAVDPARKPRGDDQDGAEFQNLTPRALPKKLVCSAARGEKKPAAMCRFFGAIFTRPVLIMLPFLFTLPLPHHPLSERNSTGHRSLNPDASAALPEENSHNYNGGFPL